MNVRITGKKSLRFHGAGSEHEGPHAVEGHAPEEIQKAKRLDTHADKWPFNEYENNTAQETYRASQLLLPCEEIKCLLGANDES